MIDPQPGPPRALTALLDRAIDYAGLFPPATLDMQDTVRRFARYRRSPDAWALGRLVVPVARLDEFERAFEQVAESQPHSEPRTQSSGPNPGWRLTALAALPLDEHLARVQAFNSAHAGGAAGWPARIDSMEIRVTSAGEIERASACSPAGLQLFFEVPEAGGIEDLAGAAAAAGRGLKIRTGGTTPDAFPSPAVIARFLGACAAARVPFKATAGLHHAIRSVHPVTGEPSAPSIAMHGFLNLLVAAALLLAGRADVATATRVLDDATPTSFRFDNAGLTWRDSRLGVAEVSSSRAYARSFGSCSFEDPLAEIGPGGRFDLADRIATDS